MFSITPWKLILLYWLDFYFCYYNWSIQISFQLPTSLLPPGFEPGTLTPRVSMFSITPWKLILLFWLDFYFCYYNWSIQISFQLPTFFFTSTRIWTWNPHSKSEYVFYYTMKANFVVLARFLLNLVNIIEASKSVSSCQLFFLLPPGFKTWNPHSKSEYVFYYTMGANFVVLARFLFL